MVLALLIKPTKPVPGFRDIDQGFTPPLDVPIPTIYCNAYIEMIF